MLHLLYHILFDHAEKFAHLLKYDKIVLEFCANKYQHMAVE